MKLHRWTFAFTLLTLFAACSQQGEGERCVKANGDGDCGSGLVCTTWLDLESEFASAFPTDRCCPPESAKTWSDSRCQPRSSSGDNGTNNTAGTAGTSSTGSQAGAGGSAGAAGQSTGAAGSVGEVAGTANAGSANAGSAGAIEENAGTAGESGAVGSAGTSA